MGPLLHRPFQTDKSDVISMCPLVSSFLGQIPNSSLDVVVFMQNDILWWNLKEKKILLFVTTFEVKYVSILTN